MGAKLSNLIANLLKYENYLKQFAVHKLESEAKQINNSVCIHFTNDDFTF